MKKYLLASFISLMFLTNFCLVLAQDFKNFNLEEILPLNNNLLEKAEAFKKVLDLALIEAKDLKIKLTSLDKLNKEELEFQTEFLKELNEAILFYEKKKETFLNQDNLDLQFLKNEAKVFKTWRDENYLPLNKKIIDFILIKQQKKALEITKNRYQKIESDLKKLDVKKIKNKMFLNKINQFFDELKKELNLAENNYQKAEELFGKLYFKNVNLSTEDVLDSKNNYKEVIDLTSTTLAISSLTSSKDFFDKSILDEKQQEKKEIKELILDSFNNVKNVYKNFIEISKLFNNL